MLLLVSSCLSCFKHQLLYFYAVFAWDAYERGSDVHLQADPTKLELLHKTYQVKKEGFKEEQKGGILSKVLQLQI